MFKFIKLFTNITYSLNAILYHWQMSPIVPIFEHHTIYSNVKQQYAGTTKTIPIECYYISTSSYQMSNKSSSNSALML